MHVRTCINSLQLPVIAVDSYCPVVNPFTSTQHGYLAVLLAMGSNQQVHVHTHASICPCLTLWQLTSFHTFPL